MPVWAERPAPREEGRRKSEGNRIGSRQGGRGVGEGTIFNHGVDPQLQISENLGLITQAAHPENLRLPVGADGRVICLQFSLKRECHRSCKRSHAPLHNHNWELVIRLIRGAREAMNKNKRKFDGVGKQGSHGEHWDRCGHHGHRNSDIQNGARFGGGRGGVRDRNNSVGGVGQGGNGSNTNPPPPRRTENLGWRTEQTQRR